MNFSLALAYLKDGKRVARLGWNGRKMHIVLMPGYPNGIEANEETSKAHNIPENAIVIVRPYIAMFDAQQAIVPGWLASQTDLLADDWIEVS